MLIASALILNGENLATGEIVEVDLKLLVASGSMESKTVCKPGFRCRNVVMILYRTMCGSVPVIIGLFAVKCIITSACSSPYQYPDGIILRIFKITL